MVFPTNLSSALRRYSRELMDYMEMLKCSHGLYGMYDILKLQMRKLNPIKFCHVIFLISPKLGNLKSIQSKVKTILVTNIT